MLNIEGNLTEYTNVDQLSPYGNYRLVLTEEQLEGLKEGKEYILTDEYGMVVCLAREEQENE